MKIVLLFFHYTFLIYKNQSLLRVIGLCKIFLEVCGYYMTNFKNSPCFKILKINTRGKTNGYKFSVASREM